MKPITLIAALALACGGDQAAFRPTDNVTRSAPGGEPAASYEIRGDAQSNPHARVNVWSRGVSVENGVAIARVALEIRNLGDQPITLDPNELQLEAYNNDGAQMPSGRLVQSYGPLYVYGGEATSAELAYSLGDVDPDGIGNLRLRWAVHHDDGKRYVQFTDFRRIRDYVAHGVYYYDPIYGYYDPFLYGPPYHYRFHHRVPVGRVIIHDRDRPRSRTVIRDR